MEHSRIGPAREGEAGELFTPANTPAVNTSKPKIQGRIIPPLPALASVKDHCDVLIRTGLFKAAHAVTGELGPIHLLKSRDGSSHSPRVFVGFNDTHSIVWIDVARLPWGWTDPYQIFVSRNHRGAAVKYAVALAEKVRVAAEAEQERRERSKAAHLREKSGGGR